MNSNFNGFKHVNKKILSVFQHDIYLGQKLHPVPFFQNLLKCLLEHSVFIENLFSTYLCLECKMDSTHELTLFYEMLFLNISCSISSFVSMPSVWITWVILFYRCYAVQMHLLCTHISWFKLVEVLAFMKGHQIIS